MKVLSIIRFAIRQENFRHSFKASELNRFSTSEYHKHFKIGTMRKLLVLLALPLLVLSACSETTKEEIADLLIISQDNVAFPMEGGQATISVACPSQWSSTVSDPSWITATDGDGNVSITVKANTTSDSRKGAVTLESAGGTKEIKVSQSWTGGTLSLTINGPESMELDSEGEGFAFSVESNTDWKATTDASWLTLKVNGAVVNVDASANTGEHREATITVSASSADKTENKTIKVSQISRGENAYYNMLGYYGLYAERWYYNSNTLEYPGTGTHCTVEQKEYGKSFIIKDLFVDGTEVGATYDPETKRMVIVLGGLCLSVANQSTTRYYYMIQTNMTARNFTSGVIYGTVGTGYSDESKADRPAIRLSGFDPAYGSLGLIGRDVPGSNGYAMFSDVYYAGGEMYLVKADKANE